MFKTPHFRTRLRVSCTCNLLLCAHTLSYSYLGSIGRSRRLRLGQRSRSRTYYYDCILPIASKNHHHRFHHIFVVAYFVLAGSPSSIQLLALFHNLPSSIPSANLFTTILYGLNSCIWWGTPRHLSSDCGKSPQCRRYRSIPCAAAAAPWSSRNASSQRTMRWYQLILSWQICRLNHYTASFLSLSYFSLYFTNFPSECNAF